MDVLVFTDEPLGPNVLLPSLGTVAQRIDHLPLADFGGAIEHGDVIIVDATTELARALAVCRAPAVHAGSRPVLLIVEAAVLAAIKVGWGFDDWVLKDCTAQELATRLRLLRDTHDVSSPHHYAGPLSLDAERYEVRVHDEVLDLTFREFELLRALWSRPGRVWIRAALLREVWDYGDTGAESRTVDVHIRRLRAKVGPEVAAHIQTIRGVGYKFEPALAAPAEPDVSAAAPGASLPTRADRETAIS